MDTNGDNDLPPRKHRCRRCRFTYVLYGLAGAVVVGVLAFAVFQPIKVLPRMRLAPGFAFVDQSGQQRTSEDYRGRATIISFACARCDDATAGELKHLAALRSQLRASPLDSIELSFVTISVDPDHDAAEAWKSFASKFTGESAADPVRWDFVTGDADTTKLVVGGGFNVFYSVDAQKVQLEGRVVVIDGWGIIRAEYRTADFNTDVAMRDLQYLAAEARNRDGLAHLAYEAAHLFRCYA